MTYQELQTLLRNPSCLETQHLPDLISLSAQYPYCGALHRLILICLHRSNDLRYAAELHRRILSIGDPEELFMTLRAVSESSNTPYDLEEENDVGYSMDEEPEGAFALIESFLEEHPEDTTEIDLLLEQSNKYDEEVLTPAVEGMGHESVLAEESKVAEPVLDSNVGLIDSGDLLTSTALTPESSQSVDINAVDSFESARREVESTTDILDAFLSQGPEAEVIHPVDEVTEDDLVPLGNEESASDDYLTETLARIYIRQGKYDRALRIFNSLHLKYPKKSGYFAEQIAYLEKIQRLLDYDSSKG